MSARAGGYSPGLTVRGRAVADLSDAELEAEAALRRSARRRAPQLGGRSAHAPVVHDPASRTGADAAAAQPPLGRLLLRRELEQYLANLELSPGASLDAVREQYFRLRERYDPKKQATEDKRRVAEALVERLMRAYEAVSAHYEAKGLS